MAHIIVDGYNMIRRVHRFLMAESLGLESGRDALLMALETYGAQHGHAITVVFDGHGRPLFEDANLPSFERFAGIDVFFSGRGQTADTVISRLIARERDAIKQGEFIGTPPDIVLITDDFDLRDEAIQQGAFVRSPEEFVEALEGRRPLRY